MVNSGLKSVILATEPVARWYCKGSWQRNGGPMFCFFSCLSYLYPFRVKTVVLGIHRFLCSFTKCNLDYSQEFWTQRFHVAQSSRVSASLLWRTASLPGMQESMGRHFGQTPNKSPRPRSLSPHRAAWLTSLTAWLISQRGQPRSQRDHLEIKRYPEISGTVITSDSMITSCFCGAVQNAAI